MGSLRNSYSRHLDYNHLRPETAAKVEGAAPDPPEPYQREAYLNPDCFSRLLNGAVLPPPQLSPSNNPPSPMHSPIPPFPPSPPLAPLSQPSPSRPLSPSPIAIQPPPQISPSRPQTQPQRERAEELQRESSQTLPSQPQQILPYPLRREASQFITLTRESSQILAHPPSSLPPLQREPSSLLLTPQPSNLELDSSTSSQSVSHQPQPPPQNSVPHIQTQPVLPIDTRWITSLFLVMLHNEAKIADGNLLWELIYPKTKEGRPMYNPSGKYCVKLFVMGAWRKITIDDRIPIDENGSIMLMQTNTFFELWPLLVAKALFKVATLMQVYSAFEPEFFYWLGGWVPQIEPPLEENTWSFLHNLQESKYVITCVTLNSFTPESTLPASESADNLKTALFSGLRAGQLYLVCGLSQSPKMVNLRTIAPPRVAHPRPSSSVGGRMSRPSSAIVNHEDQPPLYGSEVWVSYDDFCTYFRSMLLYHSPDYPSQAVIQALGEVPTYIPPLLYTESDVPTHIVVSVSVSPQTKPEEGENDGSITLMLERYHWTTMGTSPDAPLLTLKTKTPVCTLVWVPPGRNVYKILVSGKRGYQMRFSSPTTLTVGDYSKILPKLNLEVSEYDVAYKSSDPGIWSLWFKYNVQVQEEGVWSWQLVTEPNYSSIASSSTSVVNAPGPSPSLQNIASSQVPAEQNRTQAYSVQGSSSAALAAPYVRMRIIDNDTFEEYPSFLGASPPRKYQPNQFGYTVLAECKCPFRVPASRCRVRVISTSSKFSVEPESLKVAYECEDAYTPTQTLPLFRDVLRVKEKAQVAVHVGVPSGNGNLYIKLQVFDKGEEICSAEGKRCCTIPVLYLHPTPKKDDESHKYILQATILRYIPSFTDDTPRARVRTRKPKAKKEKTGKGGGEKGGASSAWADFENVWQLKIVSAVPVDVKKDTEREDYQASIKAAWEVSVPGRAAKARASRDRYLHGLSLLPPSLDPEGKEGPPKYVPMENLPVKKIRITREGAEDEFLDLKLPDPKLETSPSKSGEIAKSEINKSGDKIVNEPKTGDAKGASKNSMETTPSQLRASKSTPIVSEHLTKTPSSRRPLTATLPTVLPSGNPLSPSPSSSTPPIPPSPTRSPSPTPPKLPRSPSTSSVPPNPFLPTSPPLAFPLARPPAKIPPMRSPRASAHVRTDTDAAHDTQTCAQAGQEFATWHDESANWCRDQLKSADAVRDALLGYFELQRAEMKRMNADFMAKRELYNAKRFPRASSPPPPPPPKEKEKEKEKELPPIQPKEKPKRKKERVAK